MPTRQSEIGNRQSAISLLSTECLDFHVDSSWKIELHQRINRLRCRVENVHQAFVCTNLELLPRLLINVRRTKHSPLVFYSRQRDRTRHARTSSFRSFYDFRCRLIEHAVVVRFQTDANAFSQRHFYFTISDTVPAPTVRPPSRIANRNPLSIATGVINSTTRLTLSPGITISVPSGNCATPVTSVVRK